jgi:predicted DNA-binding transcriptional regulator AlpA
MISNNQNAERWRAALHEAGHLVAAEVMLNGKNGAVVVSMNDGTAGQAYIDVGDPPRSFSEALAIAAGTEAEGLAEFHDAPALPPSPMDVVRPDVPPQKSSHASIVANIQAGPSDDLRIAKWCCEDIPDQPARWIQRHTWIHREARFLVRDHTARILEAARELYMTGVIISKPNVQFSKEGATLMKDSNIVCGGEEMNERPETVTDQNGASNDAEDSTCVPLVCLDEIGANTIIDEAHLAQFFGRCRKSIKRSVSRGELPTPVRMFGQDTWLAGSIAAHMKARMESAARDRARLARKPV